MAPRLALRFELCVVPGEALASRIETLVAILVVARADEIIAVPLAETAGRFLVIQPARVSVRAIVCMSPVHVSSVCIRPLDAKKSSHP
ncbi:MAG TPA: hypothetical protein VGK80_05040 [Rhodanobacteraceae bacterium]